MGGINTTIAVVAMALCVVITEVEATRRNIHTRSANRRHTTTNAEEIASNFHYLPNLDSYMGVNMALDDNIPHKSSVVISHEAMLIRYLLHRLYHFGMLARPLLNSSHAVSVQFGMALVQILDFDETRQLIVTHVWKSYQWTDEVLTWNPADFGGIKDLRLPPYVAWTPDIVLYNSADDSKQHESHNELLAVFSNGTIKWIPASIYKSSCLVDMTNFPFDQQTCHLKFGSWTYDGLKLHLGFLMNESSIDWGEYVESAEWTLVTSRAWREERHYQCCGDDPYPELIYQVTLQRRTAFYVVVLVLPCLLLSCLTLVMFWYPPQRPDRTGLGMSLFSSYFVLLLILVQASPPTAQSISLLGVYYMINMILIALSTALSALVINVLQEKDKRVMVPRVMLQWNKQMLVKLFFQAQGMMVQTKYTKDGIKQPPRTTNGPIQTDDQGQTFIDWSVLAKALDRLFFTLYTICIILALIFVFPR